VLLCGLALACTDAERQPRPLEAKVPLHLEEHLDVARLEVM
jgi:hypothetical protein